MKLILNDQMHQTTNWITVTNSDQEIINTSKEFADRASTLITDLLLRNSAASDVISGWRHGYHPAAVARYVLKETLSERKVYFGMNGAQAVVYKAHMKALKLCGAGWGAGYDYFPAISELERNPAEVQCEINLTLKLIDKITPDLNDKLGTPVFNEPKDNPSVIKDDRELLFITNFMKATRIEILNILSMAFIIPEDEYQAAVGN